MLCSDINLQWREIYYRSTGINKKNRKDKLTLFLYPEAVRKDGSSILFNPNNTKELSLKIKWLWENPEIVKQMKRKCKNHKHRLIDDY